MWNIGRFSRKQCQIGCPVIGSKIDHNYSLIVNLSWSCFADIGAALRHAVLGLKNDLVTKPWFACFG